MGGPVNLLNFPKTALSLESRLAKMRRIKPNQDFPVMTVSKFLHFYNPGLFPIYDTEMIWEKVFKRLTTTSGASALRRESVRQCDH